MASTTPSRTMPALFAGVALLNAAMAASSAVSTIVAADQLGAQWSGVPNTAGIVGTGVGALALSRVMTRWGRRAGLVLGYLAALVGAVVAAFAVSGDGPAYLICGMLLLGLGNAGAQLSRYVAAELYPPHRHGFAIGAVVSAGALGAVGGPLLLDPSGRLATARGWAELTGPFLLAMVAAGIAALAAAGAPAGRSGPAGPSRTASAPAGPSRTASAPAGPSGPAGAPAGPSGSAGAAGEGAPLRTLMRTPAARAALAVMATAQVAMVVVMTAMPLDMHLHGHGLGTVGAALSAHTLGMFALSPVTGRLLDRLGPRPVMLAGLFTLAAAAALAAAADEPAPRTAGLFLLGYGWNLCFIGGTGRLTRGLATEERLGVEGAVDASVWTVAAAGSLASTALLTHGGFPLLAMVTAVLVLVPVLLLRQPDRAGSEREQTRGGAAYGQRHDRRGARRRHRPPAGHAVDGHSGRSAGVPAQGGLHGGAKTPGT